MHVWGCCRIYVYGRVYHHLMLYVPCGILGITMERRCGQYSVTNCRNVGAELSECWCDVGLPVQCFRLRSSKIDVDLRRSMIDVSTFEDRRWMCRPSRIDDRCVDLRRWMIDVPTFEDRWSLCQPSKTDDRCEIMLLHLLYTLMV